MSDGTNSQASMDPIEVWRQWNETTSKMWSATLERGKEVSTDPYGLYRLWLKNIEEAQEQLKAGPLGMMNSAETWKQWFDATAEFWSRVAETGEGSLELTTQWLKILEETRARMLSGEIRSVDPFTFFKQWYDATSETLSQVVGDTISSERFMQANRRFIENYTSAVSISNRVKEEVLKNLQIPSRSDIARVAGLVISLEEKVDTIEDAFEGLEESYSKVATSEAVESLAGRLEQVENKLERLDTLPMVLEKIEAMGGLEGRLEQVESKLGTLPAALEKIEALGGLEGRLERVESKMDTLLLALEKIETRISSEAVPSRGFTGRRAQKKNEESQEVKDAEPKIEQDKEES